MSPWGHRVRFRRPWAALALGLAVLTGAVACADRDLPSAPGASSASTSPTASSPALADAGTTGTPSYLGLSGGLLSCTPLPAAHAEALIGPEGGTLAIGPHTFTVPAGALSDTVRIVADAPSAPVSAVRFGPEGLRFAPGHPARLTLSYAHCPPLAQVLPKRIAYTDDSLRILEVLGSLDRPLAGTVSGDVAHFSRYAVAW